MIGVSMVIEKKFGWGGGVYSRHGLRRLGLIRVAVITRLYATRPSLRESHNRPKPSIEKTPCENPAQKTVRSNDFRTVRDFLILLSTDTS